MDNLDKKYIQFEKIITAWRIATEGICSLNSACKLDGNEEEAADELRHGVDNIMLTAIKRLMRISEEDVTIYDDEWFWAEWDTSKECFYYIYGKTSNLRCERALGPQMPYHLYWPKDAYMIIWRGNYKTEAKMISNEFANDYFDEDNGFMAETRKEILDLADGEYCNADEDGLFIFKG